MAELQDLKQLVKNNPQDYDQRWRLAKKLYLACEYAQALEHLLILKSKWTRKLNVLRYLSATYYRLGRYEDSIAELRETLEMWPEEIGLHEQYARVLEIAGRRDEAAAEWQIIKELKSTHPLADSAIRRLRSRPKDSAHEDLRLTESDSGISLPSGLACANCGALNSAEFERCWQCHAPLNAGTPTPRTAQRKRPPGIPPALFALITVGVLAGGVYLTLLYLPGALDQTRSPRLHESIYNAVGEALLFPRVIAGLLLMVLWPLSLVFAMDKLGVKATQTAVGAAPTGAFLASCAYLSFWTPVYLLPFAPAAVAILSFFVILLMLNITVKQALIAWAFTGGAAALVSAVAFMALTSPSILAQAPAIARASHAIDVEKTRPHAKTPTLKTPVTIRAEWESTGSPWLDEHAGGTRFVVTAEVTRPPMIVEVRDAEETHSFKDIISPEYEFTTRVQPGKTYEILVFGTDGKDVTIAASGILTPKFSY